jgi:methyl-accepting chemotaxis protein
MLIRTRITIASLAATVVAVVTLGVAGYSSQRAAEARYVEASLWGKRILLEQLVARHASEMQAHVKAVTRDSMALKALRGGDLKTLQEQVDTTYNTFNADGTMDRLAILDPEGRYLAAAPQVRSGATDSEMVLRAASEGAMLHGLLGDAEGGLQASLVFPLYARGKLKGVAVYSRDIQRIVDDFRHNDGSDVFVLDVQGQQRHAAAENTAKALVRGPDRLESGNLEIVRDAGRYLAMSSIPLASGDGQSLGFLVTVEDQTETYEIQVMATYTSWAVVLVMLALSAFGLFWYIRRSFRPIDGVVASMTAIAAGQLNCNVTSERSTDETGRLTAALCSMVEQLRELVSDITLSSESLTKASGELRDISDGNTSSIATQSQETDQLATAINEMTANVQEVANNALMAAESTTAASRNAEEGHTVVKGTIQSITLLADEIERAGGVIERLRQESESIGGVLEVIRTISEQTNLLALNAAIEAARAGEYGRGFAVVADEVRTLASRTQNSTQEIQDMIQRLQAQATEAVEVIAASRATSTATVESAAQAGGALEAITESATTSNAMNKQIARAAEEQHTVAEMINNSVVHIAQLSEESTRRTQQARQAAESMSELSTRLGNLVHRFQL